MGFSGKDVAIGLSGKGATLGVARIIGELTIALGGVAGTLPVLLLGMQVVLLPTLQTARQMLL